MCLSSTEFKVSASPILEKVLVEIVQYNEMEKEIEAPLEYLTKILASFDFFKKIGGSEIKWRKYICSLCKTQSLSNYSTLSCSPRVNIIKHESCILVNNISACYILYIHIVYHSILLLYLCKYLPVFKGIGPRILQNIKS